VNASQSRLIVYLAYGTIFVRDFIEKSLIDVYFRASTCLFQLLLDLLLIKVGCVPNDIELSDERVRNLCFILMHIVPILFLQALWLYVFFIKLYVKLFTCTPIWIEISHVDNVDE